MRKPLKILFFLLIAYSAKAQHLTHDIGLFVGSATIQTDYGKKSGFFNRYEISALSVSLVHYLHFFNIDTRWNSKDDIANHLMIKSEFNFLTKKKFNHFGKFSIGDSELAKQLRAMSGTTKITNFAVHGEYYLKDLKDFMFPFSDIKWNPYFSLGFAYSIYTNTLTTTLGDWRSDITLLPEKYRKEGELDVGTGSTFSFIIGTGTRYKLSENFDLGLNFNMQYFFTDYIEGLKSFHDSNKHNEWLLNLQVGIIYHLNFSGGIFCKKLKLF